MSLYQTLNKTLEPVLGDRTRMVLEEGVRRLGVNPDNLDQGQAEVILKRLVYRELQSKMSPTAARAQIEEVLKAIGGNPAGESKMAVQSAQMLASLETGLKRFSLYLDWPEVGRLRGLINVIKQDPEASTVRALLREGQEVLAQLEEKLQSALLRQTRDIADLQMALQRVQSVGGPKARRLETLLRQIEEAHEQETLAPAEVDRARSIAAEMRKLVESSVVQNPPMESAIILDDEEPSSKNPTTEVVWDDSELVLDLDFDALTSEQQSRIKEIDIAEDQRRLDVLKERYAPVLGHKEVALEITALQDELMGGNPLGERIAAFEAQLKNAYAEVLSEARVRYEWLVERLRRLELDPAKTAVVQGRLAVVLETLQAGGLPQELAQLEQTLAALETEDKAAREQRERQNKLRQALDTLRVESETSLSSFRGNPQVEAFLASLASLEPSEANLQAVRQQHSGLLSQLAKEREEEGLRRMGLRAAVQALPTLEQLEPEKQSLLTQLDQPMAPLADLERTVAAFVDLVRSQVEAKLEAIEARLKTLIPSEQAQAVQSQIAQARQALSSGQMPNPGLIERNLQEAITVQREAVAEELTRYEAAGRSLRGLGGEELEAKVAQLQAALQKGELPNLEEPGQLLGRLRRAQEALRAELGGRISALLEAYSRHKSVGGETVLRLKPLCDFLQSASDRLARLGASGLLEVRRALEEAERLELQLASEFQAAQSLMQELKGADLEALLDVFDSPSEIAQNQAAQPQAKPSPPAQPLAPAQPAPLASAGANEALASFSVRGVEAVALVEGGKVVWGSLPFSAGAAQAVFDELRGLANELSGQSAQLSVISLTHSVLLLVPLGSKGLTILAEKALLSRLLAQIDKQREVLEKV